MGIFLSAVMAALSFIVQTATIESAARASIDTHNRLMVRALRASPVRNVDVEATILHKSYQEHHALQAKGVARGEGRQLRAVGDGTVQGRRRRLSPFRGMQGPEDSSPFDSTRAPAAAGAAHISGMSAGNAISTGVEAADDGDSGSGNESNASDVAADNGDRCPICFDDIMPTDAAMRCRGDGGRHHYFHQPCMQ